MDNYDPPVSANYDLWLQSFNTQSNQTQMIIHLRDVTTGIIKHLQEIDDQIKVINRRLGDLENNTTSLLNWSMSAEQRISALERK